MRAFVYDRASSEVTAIRAVSMLAQRLVSALLFGVKLFDLGTLAATAGFILVVTASAALIPARRAAQTDPLTALRYE